MDLHFSPKVAKFAFSTEMKLFIHARKSASFGGMYLVIRHHLANGFRRPCVFSCQMAIDSHQTAIDSHQTTMDSYQTAIDSRQVNRTAGECSRARRMGRMSHKAMSRGTVRRAPTPYQQGRDEGGSTPAPEVEQHLQQIGVVYNPIVVHIFGEVACLSERVQHGKQISIVHAAIERCISGRQPNPRQIQPVPKGHPLQIGFRPSQSDLGIGQLDIDYSVAIDVDAAQRAQPSQGLQPARGRD
jgi:hypothetical protein